MQLNKKEADCFARTFASDDGKIVLEVLKRNWIMPSVLPNDQTQILKHAVASSCYSSIIAAIRMSREIKRGRLKIKEDDADGRVE